MRSATDEIAYRAPGDIGSTCAGCTEGPDAKRGEGKYVWFCAKTCSIVFGVKRGCADYDPRNGQERLAMFPGKDFLKPGSTKPEDVGAALLRLQAERDRPK